MTNQFANMPSATYVSAGGEFGTPGGAPPASYNEGLPAPVATPRPVAGLDNPDPYAAFKVAFQKDYGRAITQEEMNLNESLIKLGISNDLFRLLPLDRQMGFSSDRLGKLDNPDLQRLIEHNPQVAGAFPTKFWEKFSNDWLAKVVGPFLQTANPGEWSNIVTQNQIGGEAAGALAPSLQPGATPAPTSTAGDTLAPTARSISPLSARPAGAAPIQSFQEPTIGQGSTSLDIFRNTLNPAPTRASDAPGTSRLMAQIDPITGEPVEGQPQPAPEPGPQPGAAPPGWIENPNYIPGLTHTDNPRFIRAPSTPTGRQAPTEQEQRYTETQIAALEARIKNDEEQLAQAKQNNDFNQQFLIQQRLDKLQADLQNYTLQRDQLTQRQAEFGATAGMSEAGLTGYYGGAPTMQREQQTADQALKNYAAKIDAAYKAGQLSLQDRNAALQEAQFKFGVERDPASAFTKTYNAAALSTPGGAQGAPSQGATVQGAAAPIAAGEQWIKFDPATGKVGYAPAGTPGYEPNGVQRTMDNAPTGLATTATPLTTQQAFRGNANLAAPIRKIAGTEGDFQLPNYASLERLLPSQREQVGAGLKTMGYNPEDVIEQSRRLTTTTAPSRSSYSRGSQRKRPSLI